MACRRFVGLVSIVALILVAGPVRGQEAPAPPSPDDLAQGEALWEGIQERARARDWPGLWDLMSEEAQEEFMTYLVAEKRAWRRAPGETVEKITGLPHATLLSMGWRDLWSVMVEAEIKREKLTLVTGRWRFEGIEVEGIEGVLRLRDAKGKKASFDVLRDRGSWRIGDFKKLTALLASTPERERLDVQRSAVSCLKALSTGQEQFKNAVAVDRNQNGIGEYGTLDELAGTKACRGDGPQFAESPFLPPSLGGADERGVVVRNGYCFVCFLPTGPTGATATDLASVDVAANEVCWIGYAWPLDASDPLAREYVMDAQGQPYGRTATHRGAADVPAWHEALAAAHWAEGIDAKVWTPVE